MIEIKNLSKYYNNGGVTTLGLHNINLSFEKNEIVGIVGESGSGKSTLLNVISGMDSYDDGEILFNGEETSYFDERDRDEFRKKNVAFINQNYNIIDSYSVLENVTLPLIINGMSEKEAIEKAKVLIEKVHLSHRIRSKGSQLSGGEKQRCVIARALAKDTPILACDEPTGNLDSKSGEDIINLLKEVSAGKLVLIVTHNEEQADPILTRKIRIHDGQVAEDISMGQSSSIDEEVVKPAEIKKNKWLQLSMAWKNIKGTPKKNIFSTIVFTVFSFAMVFLYLLASQSGVEAGYSNSSHYANMARDRVIVYNADHSPINPDKFNSVDGKQYENAFYEDMNVSLIGTKTSTTVVMSFQFPSNAALSYMEDQSETQNIYPNVAVVVGSDYYGGFSDYDMGTNMYIGRRMGYSNTYLDIGTVHLNSLWQADGITTPILVFNENDANMSLMNKLFTNYYILDTVTTATGEKYTSSTAVLDFNSGAKTSTSEAKVTKNTLIYKGNKTMTAPASVTATIGGLYAVDFTDFNFVTQPSDSDQDAFEFICAKAALPTECYELTIYTENIKSVQKIAKSAGYETIVPSRAQSENARSKNISRIITIMLYVLVTITGFILTFAVYGILSRVYLTKTKDFTIFRSLGVLKKDLRGVVSLEVAFIAMISSVISIGGILILGCVTDYFHTLISAAPIWSYFFFFIVLQLLALIISNRFNKRLFKLTINDSLKEERR